MLILPPLDFHIHKYSIFYKLAVLNYTTHNFFHNKLNQKTQKIKTFIFIHIHIQ